MKVTHGDYIYDAECDEDEARWDERLRKIARQKPVEKPDGSGRDT